MTDYGLYYLDLHANTLGVPIAMVPAAGNASYSAAIPENTAIPAGAVHIGAQDAGGSGKIKAGYGEDIGVVYKDALDDRGNVDTEKNTFITVSALAQNPAFTDQDPDAGQISGDITWDAADYENLTTNYVVYYLDSTYHKLAEIDSVAVDGSLSYSLTVPADIPPDGAIYIGIFSKNTNDYDHMTALSANTELTDTAALLN